MNKLLFFAVLSLVCLYGDAYGQVDSLAQVSIRGRVLDSLSKEPVSEATVTLYQKNGEKMLKYGFTDGKGGFTFSHVSTADSVFSLEVSHLGFATSTFPVELKEGNRTIDVGRLSLSDRSIQIEEVLVVRPPVQMRGDTLEINPEAFDMEPNAVVEDLLKKVPGIVVWSDGDITVNGKEVERVLVNGKPFFGKDALTATRNLPSGAVDKLKVYESKTSQPDREEKMEMDIRLKKTNGLFGKAQLGIGNQNRKEGIFLLNYFDAKNQISVFGGKNNTNKRISSVAEALRSSVYKAGGEDINVYAPVFGRPGANRFATGGGRFEREWNVRVKSNIDALYTGEETDLRTDLTEFRSFENQNDQKIEQSSKQYQNQDRFTAGARVDFKQKYRNFKFHSRIRDTKTSSERYRRRNVEDADGHVLSEFITEDKDAGIGTTGEFGVSYAEKYKERRPNNKIIDFSYRLITSKQKDEKQQSSSFYEERQQHTEAVDRIKTKEQDRNQHDLALDIDLTPLVNTRIEPMKWPLIFTNTANWLNLNADQKDVHFDPSTQEYSLLNESLTYTDRYNQFDWRPGLGLRKFWSKTMARGKNSWGFNSQFDLSTSFRKNRSDHALRQLNQRELLFMPTGDVYYRKERQLWTSTWTVALNTDLRKPGLEQLVGVKDEAQKDFNRLGNRELKSEGQYRLGLKYARRSNVNSSTHNVKAEYVWVANQMVDSSFFDENGSRISYVVNSSGRPFYEANYSYKSAPKVKEIPLNISFTAKVRKGENYYYSNGEQFVNSNFTSSLDAKVTGTLYEHFLLSVHGADRLSRNTTKSYSRSSGTRSFGTDLTVTRLRRTTFISSFTGSHYYIKGVSSDYQFFWNAHVYYRMLEKEQLEVKFSVFDILNNSKNIRTFSDNNIVRREQSNNLRQYFMVSLSYYPRFF